MEKIVHSPQFIRQRKFMLVLPLLVLPFLTIVFVALGGGKGSSSLKGDPSARGLNLQLPEARFKREPAPNKMSFYDLAHRDSMKFREAVKADPYRQLPAQNQVKEIYERTLKHYSPSGGLITTLDQGGEADARDARVLEKLAQLKREINRKTDPNTSPVKDRYADYPAPESGQLRKWERVVTTLQNQRDTDPEISQLNGLLDKVLAIQHPEIKDSTPIANGLKDSVQPVSLVPETADSLQADTPVITQNGFYGFADEGFSEVKQGTGITAFIPLKQVLVTGSTVKLCLSRDIYLKGVKIPVGQFIYGQAYLSNERLKINISSIRLGEELIPVSLEVYDLDGQAGIYTPGSLKKDAARQSSSQLVSEIGTGTLDPSLGAQAANAGIQTARSLFSRRVRQVKVTIPSGYQVLLKDNSRK